MIKDNVTLGLRVQTLNPAPHTTDVDVNTDIRLHLNHEINPKSVMGTFSVLEDVEWSFNHVDQLQDRSKFEVVRGAISYQDRVLTFKPSKPLKEHSRYIIVLKANGVKSIDGSTLTEDFSSMFYTECEATLPQAVFESPKFGLIGSQVPTFTWADQKASSYIFQVSASHEFESLVYNELIIKTIGVCAKTTITPVIDLKSGLYYARVKASNGHWSEPHQFYIEGQIQTLVSEEDFDESIFVEEYIDSDLFSTELLECFPKDGSMNTRLNTALVYGVFSGRVTKDDVDWSETYVMGELFDEEQADAERHGVEAEEHGYMDGNWYFVYDEDRDQTYIIFDLREPSDELPVEDNKKSFVYVY